VKQHPFGFGVTLPQGTLTEFDAYTERTLSAMEGQYANQQAYKDMLAEDDVVLYEILEVKRPETAGELMHGLSIVHPGRVGDEYFMTKGHFHTVLETGEVYYCLKGEGMLVMETPEGDWSVEELRAGRVVYVPPRWAHRSVNTGRQEDLVTFFIYPGNAGHDYGTIEQQGFRKLVVDRDGRPTVVDNPRWQTPDAR
jgi:glucose-6-phosphate isomerase